MRVYLYKSGAIQAYMAYDMQDTRIWADYNPDTNYVTLEEGLSLGGGADIFVAGKGYAPSRVASAVCGRLAGGFEWWYTEAENKSLKALGYHGHRNNAQTAPSDITESANIDESGCIQQIEPLIAESEDDDALVDAVSFVLRTFSDRSRQNAECISHAISGLGKSLKNGQKSSDFVIQRPYRNKLLCYGKQAQPTERVLSYEALQSSFKSLYSEDMVSRFIDILCQQPLFLVGPAGVGKNVLQDQLIFGIAQKLLYRYPDKHIWRYDVDFHENTMVSEVCDMQSISTNQIIVGAVEECIIKANEVWFGIAGKSVADIDQPYTYDTDIVLSIWNEVTRNEGYAFRKLYSFLSRRGATIQIGGQLYYNTPNLMFLMNGNTALGQRVDESILQDEAFMSRVFKHDVVGALESDETLTALKDIMAELRAQHGYYWGASADDDVNNLNRMFSSYNTLREGRNPRGVVLDKYSINLRRLLSSNNDSRVEYWESLVEGLIR